MKFIAPFVTAVILAAGGFQAGLPPLRAGVYVTGLEAPVAFVPDPTATSVFFAVEQTGRIRIVRNRVVSESLIDLRGAIAAGGERGLLGMALAPDFATSGRFFVNFTNTNGDTVVARFRRAPNGGVDATSRFDLKWGPSLTPVIAQPFVNHNGGNLVFGPDGYLYIGMGDGGSGDDPQNNAQTPSALLGKMLRIDVSVSDTHPNGYVVPADNPFVSSTLPGVRPEIWAFGLRNPWRFSFDPVSLGGSGAMLIGDVGQGSREEIDYEPPGRGGRNYGWRLREGAQPNPTQQTHSPPPAFQPLIDPIYDYPRSQGTSVTGGVVYRGRGLGAAFRGRYFFADYVSGRVWSMALSIGSNGEATAVGLTEHTAELGGSNQLGNISSFAGDASGEIYIVSHTKGWVLRVFGEFSAPAGLRIVR
jgi:glucose/arabinose dehydrogenase